jgi:membrane protease YdiL (CAAX protease family)
MAAPSPFDCYVAPAQMRRGAWRVVGGIVVTTLCWLMWTVGVLLGRLAYDIVIHKIPPGQALERSHGLLTGGSPAGLIAILTSFLGVWIGVWLSLKLFHKRPFRTLFSPERRIRWREFWAGFGLAALFFALSMAAALILVGAPARSGLELSVWALWVVPVVVAVFIQATAEELLFRGYLLQQFAAWSRNPIVWAALPSLFFGSLHLNPAVSLDANLLVVAITFLVGVIAAALVWRTGSLAAAMGMHVGVNVQALALVGAEDASLGGAQLWLYQADESFTLYAIDAVSVIALLALVLSPWLRSFGLGAAQSPQLGDASSGG